MSEYHIYQVSRPLPWLQRCAKSLPVPWLRRCCDYVLFSAVPFVPSHQSSSRLVLGALSSFKTATTSRAMWAGHSFLLVAGTTADWSPARLKALAAHVVARGGFAAVLDSAARAGNTTAACGITHILSGRDHASTTATLQNLRMKCWPSGTPLVRLSWLTHSQAVGEVLPLKVRRLLLFLLFFFF